MNLAFYFGDSRGEPVTAEQVRADVAGYPDDQDEAAFLRMFERDKDELRRSGLVIESTTEGKYRLDSASTFASKVELTAEEASTLRAIGAATLDDPSFPFSSDLRFALAKIATAQSGAPCPPVLVRTADEDPEMQAEAAATLDSAASFRKSVSFDYTNSRGEHRRREVEPYAQFLREGRWYLVGRDRSRDAVRTFAVARMSALEVDPSRPKSPDFEIPDGFDVLTFIQLPFQYGESPGFEAVIEFEPEVAWRAKALSAGRGSLETCGTDSVRWRVEARDRRRLLRWVVENGPGLRPLEPEDLGAELRDAVRGVQAVHEEARVSGDRTGPSDV